MTRYKWTIKTSDDQEDGDSGDVYLSLHGLDAATQEVQLPARDFAKGSLESGVLQIKGDLGELQTGSLRTDGGDRSTWSIDYVGIQNLSDGRKWTAKGGDSDEDGSFPLLRFEKTASAPNDSSGDDNQGSGGSENTDQPDTSPPDGPSLADRVARLEDLVNRLFPIGPPKPDLKTYELYAMLENQRMALWQVYDGQRLTPGTRLLVTTKPQEGFGLGGSPGRWADFSQGNTPEALGLDPDKPILVSDGLRGWPVGSAFLTRLLGANWRQVVYQ